MDRREEREKRELVERERENFGERNGASENGDKRLLGFAKSPSLSLSYFPFLPICPSRDSHVTMNLSVLGWGTCVAVRVSVGIFATVLDGPGRVGSSGQLLTYIAFDLFLSDSNSNSRPSCSK